MSDFQAKISLSLEKGEAISQINNLDAKLKQMTTTNHKIKVEFDSTAIKDFNSLLKNFGGGKSKTRLGVDSSEINDAVNNVNNLKDSLNNLGKSNPTDRHINGIRDLKIATKELATAKSELLKIDKSKQPETFAHMEKQVESLTRRVEGLRGVKDDLARTDKGRSILADIDKPMIAYEEKAKRATIATRDLEKAKKSAVSAFNQLQAQTSANKTEAWLRNNTRAAKEYGAALMDIANKKRMVTNASDLRDLVLKEQVITSEAAMKGLTGNSMFQDIKNISLGALGAMGARNVGQMAIRQVRQMVNEVIAVNTAFVELRKVSNESDREIAAYFTNASQMAKQLGTGISDVVRATSDWTRLGYTLNQAEELARSSILFKNVSKDITVDDATSSLVSTLQGFQLAADQSNSIVDKFNEVGNNFAIEASGIGEALKRSGASLNAANNSLSQSIALVTAAMKHWLNVWKHTLRTHLIAGKSLYSLPQYMRNQCVTV